MKRAILFTAMAACVALAGCGRSHMSAEAERLRDGVAAYRAGDRDRLVELIDASAPIPAKDACSKQAYAEARQAAAGAILAELNQGSLFSMSEEARYAFLAERHPGAFPDAYNDLPRPLGCYEASGWTKAQDQAARRALFDTYAEEAALWRHDLATQYGEQELAQRLDVATTGLQVNNVGRYAVSARTVPVNWR